MTALSQKKRSIAAMAALLFLLVTRFLFFRLELDSGVGILRFSLEGALYLLIYGMCLFELPPVIPGIALLLGCTALGFFYGLSAQSKQMEWLLPLTYFPVFLFFIDQYGMQKQKKPTAFKKLCRGLLWLYPLAFFAVLLFVFFKRRQYADTLPFIYGILLFLAVGGIYGFVAGTKMTVRTQKKTRKAERQKADDLAASAKESFILAMIIIAETGLFLQVMNNVFLTHMLPFLWIVNLLLLQDQGHPLVCAAFDRFRRKEEDFLGAAASEN